MLLTRLDRVNPVVAELNGVFRDGSLSPTQRAHAARLAHLLFGADDQLIVYGSLVPGGPNHDRVSDLEGTWIQGTLTGDLIAVGWGAAHGYSAFSWRADGPRIRAWLLRSPSLGARWEALDAFEGPEYCRVLAPLETSGGELVAVGYLYEGVGGPPL